MKMFQCAAVLLLFTALLSHLSTAHAQGTAFMYQGQLASDGSPANGTYDVEFTLYATNMTGIAIAGPVTNNATAVSNGLFSAMINFGPGVFTGTNCWLDIAVRTNGMSSFTKLTPRQPITPTPYAIFANTASNVSGTILTSQLNGLVPVAQLSSSVLTNGASGINLSGTFTGNGGGLTNLQTSVANRTENLFIVRGIVNGSGAILSGSGFSVYKVQTGWFEISFNNGSMFDEQPAVTVTPYLTSAPTPLVFSYIYLTGYVGFNVVFYNSSGTQTDPQSFGFIAAGL